MEHNEQEILSRLGKINETIIKDKDLSLIIGLRMYFIAIFIVINKYFFLTDGMNISIKINQKSQRQNGNDLITFFFTVHSLSLKRIWAQTWLWTSKRL